MKKAGNVIKEFLDDRWHLAHLFQRSRQFYKITLYIQKHIRAQLNTRWAKVDVLVNYWEKLIIHLQLRATEFNDKECNELCKRLLLVPNEVQYEVLKQWVKGCRDLHAIAFFQWRINFPHENRKRMHPRYQYDYERLSDIVEERI